MPNRDPALQALLAAVIEGLALRVEPDSPAASALARVREALASVPAGYKATPQDDRPPACAFLAPALASAREAGGAAARVAAALEALEPRITWYARQGGEPTVADFADRHALATLIGPADRPGALEQRDDLRVGLSLVAPQTPYPDHRHPPEELYLALTAGEWRQELGAWFAPGPGGMVYNRSNTLHGMRALAEPQLAVWCLPVP
jgi:quercetin dioxygenase-like cupin family protein